MLEVAASWPRRRTAFQDGAGRAALRLEGQRSASRARASVARRRLFADRVVDFTTSICIGVGLDRVSALGARSHRARFGQWRFGSDLAEQTCRPGIPRRTRRSSGTSPSYAEQAARPRRGSSESSKRYGMQPTSPSVRGLWLFAIGMPSASAETDALVGAVAEVRIEVDQAGVVLADVAEGVVVVRARREEPERRRRSPTCWQPVLAVDVDRQALQRLHDLDAPVAPSGTSRTAAQRRQRGQVVGPGRARRAAAARAAAMALKTVHDRASRAAPPPTRAIRSSVESPSGCWRASVSSKALCTAVTAALRRRRRRRRRPGEAFHVFFFFLSGRAAPSGAPRRPRAKRDGRSAELGHSSRNCPTRPCTRTAS